MKYFSHNPYKDIEKKLGYSFGNKELLATALMHRSYRFESDGINGDNQRLEFLGDSVLGLVATEHLFRRFPDLTEGPLTCLKSRMTSGNALAQIAGSIRLGEHLKLGRGEKLSGGHERKSNLEDAMEAVLGAVYLDGGLKAVNRIFKKLFLPLIDVSPDDNWLDNPKGELQKICQTKWNENPVYKLAGQEGPSHARTFTIKVMIQGKAVAAASAPNKRVAEQHAAVEAIRRLRQEGAI